MNTKVTSRIIESLICTSVNDAEISLKNMVKTDPESAKEIAQGVLNKLSQTGSKQKTRIALARRIIRMADKRILS